MSASLRIAVLKERASGETRVSATPETVKKFIALGATVAVEAGAGNGPHRTTIKLTNVTLSLYDQGTTANGGIKIYTLPAGPIALQGASPLSVADNQA